MWMARLGERRFFNALCASSHVTVHHRNRKVTCIVTQRRGRKAGVYDAEMFALAGSAAAAVPILATRPYIHRLIFYVDN